MTGQLDGKVAVITGGCSGIGLGAVELFAAEGARLVVADASAFVSGTHLVVDGGITVGGRHSWDPQTISPILELMGVTPDQVQGLRAAIPGAGG